MEQEDVADYGEGHNNPPQDEDPLAKINPERLIDFSVPDVLALNYQALDDRRDELLVGVKEWVEDHTAQTKKNEPPAKPTVGDEQDLMDTTDLVKQVRKFLDKEVEVTRKRVAKNVDQAKRDIQAFFVKGIADPVETALRPVADAQSLALIEKENRERDRLREEAYEAAMLANRLAIQARRAIGVAERESLVEQAFRIEDEAARLEAAAEAPTLELTRTRTDLGQLTGLRSSWRFEVESLMDLLMAIVSGRQDLMPYVKIDEVYANGQINRKDGVRKVPGLTIIEEKTAK